MLQHYKLRLSDGTVLMVDQDGLGAWLDDARAMVQVSGTSHWQPLREIVFELRLSARRPARPEAAPRAPLPLIPPPQPSQPAPQPSPSFQPPPSPPPLQPPPQLTPPFQLPPQPTPPPPGDAGGGPALADPAGSQVLANGPAVGPEELTLHLLSLDEEPATSPAGAPGRDAVPPPADSSWPGSLEPPFLGEISTVQVLADEPVAQPAADGRESPVGPDDPGPVIRLKPLEDEPAAAGTPAHGIARPRFEERGDESEEELRHDRLDGPLLDVLSAMGSFLSVSLGRLGRLGRRWRSSTDARRPRRRSTGKPTAGATGLPTPPKPRDAESRPGTEPQPNGIRNVASGRGADGPFERFAHGRPPAIPRKEPAPWRDAVLAPRDPPKPPPPISELPVLRFAESHEPAEAADIFEGDDAETFLPAAWLWTKRVALVGGLVAGGVYASLTWETWFPKAADLGQRMFAGIDSFVRSRDKTERQQHALDAATGQLPHLSPRAVGLVLATSPTRVLEPPEVFRLAWEAADRGVEALTPGQAEELRRLRGQVLDTLHPTEREQVLEYDRVRAHRATFAFEDRRALDLFAGAVRALPTPSRERLQALIEAAVAAGLVPPGEAAPLGAARRP
jgi:hypothetical protein